MMIVVIVSALCLCMATVTIACPTVCNCSGTTVDCDGKGLTSIPQGIPLDTEILLLDNNQLRSLNSIYNLSKLSNLSASNNQISSIHYRYTWFKLRPSNITFPALKFLNVSNNQLTNISSDTVGYLKNLKVLDFTNNPVSHASRFDGVMRQELTYFRLTSDQYICDCKLSAFRAWYISKPFTYAVEDEDLNTCRCPIPALGRTLKNISAIDMACAATSISICVNATGLGKASLNQYRLHYNQKVTAIAPIAVTTKSSEIGCVIECHHTEDCYRVSYAPSSDICQMYPFSLYDNDTSIGYAQWRYSRFVPGPTNINQTYHLP